MRYPILILSFLVIFTFGLFNSVKAQSIAGISNEEVQAEIIPSSPKPNDNVKITLSSYLQNIDTARITWKINGKVQKSGVGEKSLTFTAGVVGVKTVVDISIETNLGTISKSITIIPSSIDIIWQSHSTVPPFYKGKALFTHQSDMTVIALPHIAASNGQEISPKNLVYTWKKSGSVVETASGYGKNTYTFKSSLISRPLDIEVSVLSPTTGITTNSYVNLPPAEPSVVFYKKDPLYGITFQKAIVGIENIDTLNEISVIGFPFFFGVSNIASPDLIYKWSINGTPVNNNADSNVQVFRKKEGTSGISKISLSIENQEKILQLSKNEFGLTFNNSN